MAIYQTILITGASSGIGEALAKAYLARGAVVGVCGRDETRLRAICAGHDKAIPLVFDTTDADAARTAIESFVERAGGVDLAILNAGTHKPTSAADFSARDYATLMRVNYDGTLNCLGPVIGAMRARGGGTIAVTGSLAGYTGLPQAGAYCASKAAVMRLAETMRAELAPHGIEVKLISPGFVKTPLTDRNEFEMPFLMELDRACVIILRGLESRRFQIAFPRRLAWSLRLLSALPEPLYFSLARRMLK